MSDVSEGPGWWPACKFIVCTGVVLGGFIAAGCGSSTPKASQATTATTPATTTTSPASTTTEPSTSTIAAGFLAAANTANAAIATLQQQVSGATELNQFAGPCSTADVALETFDSTVLRLGASGQAETDIHSLVTADAALEGALSQMASGSISIVNESQWGTSVETDSSKIRAADNIVRADLDLPPETTSATTTG